MTIQERFEKKVFYCPITGCHLWSAYVMPNGYAQFSIKGHHVYAHRFAYEQAKGPIPDGLVIDHLCRVRRCVNPDHLRAVTAKENSLAPGSESPAKKASEKTCCSKCGGEYVLCEYPSGTTRRCRVCGKKNDRKYFESKNQEICERRRERYRLDPEPQRARSREYMAKKRRA